jgi:ADP-ribose pyrophosphatase YjhB (NUDIX family)
MKPRRTRIGAYALVLDERRILLCRVSPELPRWAGTWTLPGGGLRFGESPEAAVVREVEEETGLAVEVRSIAGVDSHYDPVGEHGDYEFHAVRILYHVAVVGGTLRHEAAGSTDRCEWHELPIDPSTKLGDLAEVGIRLVQASIEK